MKKTIIAAAVVAAVLQGPVMWAQQSNPEANAQSTAALEQHIRELEDRVIALEGKIRSMESAQASQSAPSAPVAQATAQVPAQATAPATPSPNETQAGLASAAGQLPIYGGASAASKALNPDVSVIGDFVGAIGGNSAPPLATLQPFPSLQMHESEIGLQAIIDPYARGDFFISFGEEGVNVEEGYITFTALPAGFVGRR